MEPMKPMKPMKLMKPMEPMKPMAPMKPMEPMSSGKSWWPSDLGEPSSSGSQNGMRYAFFPEPHRLLVEENSKLTTYDSGDHRINGVSQQDNGSRTVTFSGQNGAVKLDELKVVG